MNRWTATLIPAGLGLIWVSATFALGSTSYGWSLFLGVPFAMGALSAILSNRNGEVSAGSTHWVAQASLLIVGAGVILFAIDGLVCVLMALPIASVLVLVGSMMGRFFARRRVRPARSLIVVFLILPMSLAFDEVGVEESPLREVRTSVTIDGPIDEVWRTVVAFPRIDLPPSGLLRHGIAYPIGARIEGAGVGAIRSCEFSTGSFVEPITRWEEPHLLAFDVLESPPPMREISIYEHLDAPHLHGMFVSHRGQFALREVEGKVVLEGTTWFRQHLEPQAYWGRISDAIVHAIHQRVLDHIKATVED